MKNKLSFTILMSLVASIFTAQAGRYIEIDIFTSSPGTTELLQDKWRISLSNNQTIEESFQALRPNGIGFVTREADNEKEQVVFAKYTIIVFGSKTGRIRLQNLNSSLTNAIFIFQNNTRPTGVFTNGPQIIETSLDIDSVIEELVDTKYKNISENERNILLEQIQRNQNQLNNNSSGGFFKDCIIL